MPVELILDLLSTGWTEIMILESYPRITENHLDVNKKLFTALNAVNTSLFLRNL